MKRQKSAPDYKPTPINELKKLKHQDEDEEARQDNRNDDDDDDDVVYVEPALSGAKRKIPISGVASPVKASKSDETLISQSRSQNKQQRRRNESSDENETNSAGGVLIYSSGQNKKTPTALTTQTTTTTPNSSASNQDEEKPKRLKTNDHDEINDHGGTSTGVVVKKPTPPPPPPTASCDLVTFSKLTLSQQVLKRYEMLNKPVPSQNQLVEAKLKKKAETSVMGGGKSDKTSSNPNTPHLIIDTAPQKVSDSFEFEKNKKLEEEKEIF